MSEDRKVTLEIDRLEFESKEVLKAKLESMLRGAMVGNNDDIVNDSIKYWGYDQDDHIYSLGENAILPRAIRRMSITATVRQLRF